MEQPVAEKLEGLLKLQQIDSKIDEIRKVRGDLPEEVQDLEDEIAGYKTRLEKFDAELKELETDISSRKLQIKNSEKLIKKYEEQQSNVRNNREYDAITKEVELQQLEIQVSEKKIKEGFAKSELKKEDIEEVTKLLSERQKDLEGKKSELDSISEESQEEENKLLKDREKAAKAIEERLYHSYTKLRDNAKNGLAVVTVRRGACGGCFNTVPPQRRAEIREKKKITVCEHCGRILADVDEVLETSA